MKTWLGKWLSAILLVILFVSTMGIRPARAASIVVNSNADASLATLDANSTCDLREAVYNAVNDVGTYTDCPAGDFSAETVTFDADYTITLTAELYIGGQMMIDGNGPGNTIIQSSTCNPVTLVDSVTQATNCTPATYRVFYFAAGATSNTLKDMTIRHGNCAGACSGGLNNVGGGVFAYASSFVTLDNVVLDSNKATNDGGGVYNLGAVTIMNSIVSNNRSDNRGGAVYLDDFVFPANGALNASFSTFTNNTAGDDGGAINANGSQGVTISQSTFNANSTSQYGGAIYAADQINIFLSTFTANHSDLAGGAIYHVGDFVNASAIINSTISGNTSPQGGGVFATGDDLNIYNSAIVNNDTNGFYMYDAGGNGPFALYNTIVADNVGAQCVKDGGVTFSADAHNIATDVSCDLATQRTSAQINLQALALNGGTTASHALGANSVAVDAGDDTVCQDVNTVNNIDQRAVSRTGYGAHCDTGPYEQRIGTVTVRSTGAEDGWTLESTETSNLGGSSNSSATTFRLGDEAGDKQYRSILSFDTSAIPDEAIVSKVTLRIRKQSQTGTNPFTILGGVRVDIRKLRFGSSVNLANSDFQAAAHATNIGVIPNRPVNNWYAKTWLSGSFFTIVNRTGSTQFRLYFAKDDNDDNGADYMSFFSGDYPTVSVRPTLIIQYYVP